MIDFHLVVYIVLVSIFLKHIKFEPCNTDGVDLTQRSSDLAKVAMIIVQFF